MISAIKGESDKNLSKNLKVKANNIALTLIFHRFGMRKDEPNPESAPAQKEKPTEEPVKEKEALCQALENEYAVLIDSEKSFDEQVKIGRPLFMSLLATGTVSKTLDDSAAEFKESPRISDTLGMMISFQTERQLANARKFIPFKMLLQKTGRLNIGEILNTLIQQTILLMKQNKHFRSLSSDDQAELCEVRATPDLKLRLFWLNVRLSM